MLFILGFFLAVLWFIIPFVIFAMKGKLDSVHMLLEDIEKRIAAIEKGLHPAGEIRPETTKQGDNSP